MSTHELAFSIAWSRVRANKEHISKNFHLKECVPVLCPWWCSLSRFHPLALRWQTLSPPMPPPISSNLLVLSQKKKACKPYRVLFGQRSCEYGSLILQGLGLCLASCTLKCVWTALWGIKVLVHSSQYGNTSTIELHNLPVNLPTVPVPLARCRHDS